MTHAITPSQAAQLAEADAARQTVIGSLANEAANASAFSDYQQDKPANTLRRQAGDLAVFARYLSVLHFYTLDADKDADAQHKANAARLMSDPTAWAAITYGLINGFVKWQLQQGYAVGSINVRLATVKRYTKLAFQAGSLDTEQAAKIGTVKGFAYGNRVDIDERRTEDGYETRKGNKKAAAVALNKAQRAALMTQPYTPQGRRDTLLMCLLLEHGLRCGEIATLDVTAFAFERTYQSGTFTFYRKKVRKWQTHKLTRRSLQAARAYFESDAPVMGKLLRGSLKNGELSNDGMSERAITKRVNVLGEKIGIVSLSAHDGRHSAATEVARQKDIPLNRMVEMFGWNSPAMALFYIEAAAIANEGVNFED